MVINKNQKMRKQINQKQHRSSLLHEGLSGITIRDTLPDTSLPLTHESEAMYFKHARDFLRTTLAHNILHGHQDIMALHSLK